MLRKDWEDLDNNGQKGDWAFVQSSSGIPMIVVRFGNDAMLDCAVLYIDKEKAPAGYPVWNWNGDKENPTLTPSILVRGENGKPARWHGFLTNGKLIEC